MGVTRAQITVPQDNALPSDWITNTLYFENDSAHEDMSNDLITELTALINAIGPVTGSNTATTATIDLYRLEDPEPRVPYLTQVVSRPQGSAVGLPNEVALCVSFQGALQSGVAQARRRGRNFVGPISSSTANFASTTAGSRPSATLMGTVADAYAALLAIPAGTSNPRWVVYSPTLRALPGATLGSATTTITNLWIDDAWDIQRRRGNAPVARVVRP